MTLPFPINANQTDAKSPIDQQLMDALRLNQEYIDGQLGAGSAGGIIGFRVNGYLNRIKALLSQGAGKNLDGGILSEAVTFAKASLYLEKVGTSGALEVDVLRHKEVQQPIIDISSQYDGVIQSIGRLGSPLATQGITLATPIISTQSIARVKPTLNVESIVQVGTTHFLYTFTGPVLLDDDYKLGDNITFSGASIGSNNGSKVIAGINYDGLPSILVDNVSGAPEGSGATADLDLFEFTYSSIVDPDYFAGEIVVFAGHTSGTMNGIKTIYKTNEAGNNIWAKIPNGVTQAGVAGSAQTARILYVYGAIVDDTNYIVGEKADMTSHGSAGNNGKFTIVSVNTVGNSIKVYNSTGNGGAQAGAAGSANTLRWLYATPTDPSNDFIIGDFVEFLSTANSLNAGIFEVKNIKRFSLNNLEIYNEDGVTQGFISGGILHTKRIISFAEDFSLFYLQDISQVALEDVLSQDGDGRTYTVVEINRGGFSNYNIVISDAASVGQNFSPKGRVSREIRTIFDQRPRIEVNTEVGARFMQTDIDATFALGGVDADTILSMDILEVPEGLPSTMLLSLT